MHRLLAPRRPVSASWLRARKQGVLPPSSCSSWRRRGWAAASLAAVSSSAAQRLQVASSAFAVAVPAAALQQGARSQPQPQLPPLPVCAPPSASLGQPSRSPCHSGDTTANGALQSAAHPAAQPGRAHAVVRRLHHRRRSRLRATHKACSSEGGESMCHTLRTRR